MMKHWLVVLLLLGVTSEISAQTYYVDSVTGNDAWSGTLADVQGSDGPWKNISKVNAGTFSPGDSILFKCGGVWTEPLVVPGSGVAGNPITYGSYGASCTGSNKPVISGADAIFGWNLSSGNIYSAPVTLIKAQLNKVTNGKFDLDVRAWNKYPGDASTDPSSQVWQGACTSSGAGCMRFTASTGASFLNSLSISNAFSVVQGKRYTLKFSMVAGAANQTVKVLVRRNGRIINGSTNYDPVGLNQAFSVGTSWQNFEFTFDATSTEDNSARVDFQVNNGQTVYLDDVNVIHVTPEYDSPQQLFVDGAYMRLSQHPNPQDADKTNTYLRIASDSAGCPATGSAGVTSFVAGADLILTADQAQNLIGSGIHIRTNDWIIDDRIVTNYDPNSKTVTFDKPSSYNLCSGWGYYLDNKLWMLDAPGEWFYDSAANMVYAWLPDGSTPEGRNAAGHQAFGIDATSRGYVVIEGIRVEKAGTGIDLSYSSNVVVQSCDVVDTNGTAIVAKSSLSAAITGNNIQNSVRDGILLQLASGFSVTNNQLSNMGLVGSPKMSAAAINAASGSMGLIDGNKVTNSGYNGIFVGKTTITSNNYIENSCLVLNDCGAIYTGGADRNSTITSNIIWNTTGNLNGKPSSGTSSAQGIYLDEFASGVNAVGNTIVNSDYGFQLHKAANNTLDGNTVYNVRKSPIWMQEDVTPDSIHDNVVRNNLLFPTNTNITHSLTGRFSNINFASFDFNRYSSLYSDIFLTESYYPAGSLVTNSYSLPQWQSIRGQDINSTSFGGFSLVASRVLAVIGPNLIGNSTFDSNGSAWGSWHGALNWVANCAYGGCLQFTRDAQTGGQVNSYPFSVQQDINYILKFDARAEQGQLSVKTVVRRAGTPNYYSVGLENTVQVGTGWETYAMPFTALETRLYDPGSAGSGARVDFEVPPSQTIYIDNVRIEAVSVEKNLPGDDSVILVNKEITSSAVDCPDLLLSPAKCNEYVHFADGSPVVWPVTLQPMSSRIVVWANNPFRDDDHDGVANIDDACPNTALSVPVNEHGCSFFQLQPADITVALATSANPVNVNDVLSYTITITNNGNSPATGVTVTDNLPLGVTYVSATASQGNCSNVSGTVSCSLGSLANGANATITLVVTLTPGGSVTNTVSVAGIEYDPNTANNAATTTTQVIAPDLVPTAMSADKQGSKVYVSETVHNQGDGATGAFTVAYYLSENTIFEEGIDLPLVNTSTDSTPCARTVASLAPGASSSVSDKLCYKPVNIVTGKRYYVLVVDANTKEVIESNPSNNVKATAGQMWW